MKKTLVVALALSFPVLAHAKDASAPIQIELTRPVYKAGQSIDPKLVNVSKNRMQYQVGVETRINGQWMQTVPDIEMIRFKGQARLKNVILPKAVKQVRWPVPATPTLYQPRRGQHRFVVTYVDDPNGSYLASQVDRKTGKMSAGKSSFKEKKIISTAFEIK